MPVCVTPWFGRLKADAVPKPRSKREGKRVREPEADAEGAPPPAPLGGPDPDSLEEDLAIVMDPGDESDATPVGDDPYHEEHMEIADENLASESEDRAASSITQTSPTSDTELLLRPAILDQEEEEPALPPPVLPEAVRPRKQARRHDFLVPEVRGTSPPRARRARAAAPAPPPRRSSRLAARASVE